MQSHALAKDGYSLTARVWDGWYQEIRLGVLDTGVRAGRALRGSTWASMWLVCARTCLVRSKRQVGSHAAGNGLSPRNWRRVGSTSLHTCAQACRGSYAAEQAVWVWQFYGSSGAVRVLCTCCEVGCSLREVVESLLVQRGPCMREHVPLFACCGALMWVRKDSTTWRSWGPAAWCSSAPCQDMWACLDKPTSLYF